MFYLHFTFGSQAAVAMGTWRLPNFFSIILYARTWKQRVAQSLIKCLSFVYLTCSAWLSNPTAVVVKVNLVSSVDRVNCQHRWSESKREMCHMCVNVPIRTANSLGYLEHTISNETTKLVLRISDKRLEITKHALYSTINYYRHRKQINLIHQKSIISLPRSSR
jgi:hypothetical protein